MFDKGALKSTAVLCYLTSDTLLVKHTKIDNSYNVACIFLQLSCKSLKHIYNPPCSRQSSTIFPSVFAYVLSTG